MNYEMENNIANPEDEETILPDGWAEGDDIFAEDKWTGETAADEQEEETVEESEEGKAEEEDTAPTTEQEDTSDVNEENKEDPAPTTEQEPANTPNKLKFKARVDREDLDVELDESELPTIYQKAQNMDREHARFTEASAKYGKVEDFARRHGYVSVDAFMNDFQTKAVQSEVNRLVDKGIDEEVAQDMASRKFPVVATPTKAAEPTESGTAQRDFKAEAAVLMQARPDLAGKPLPAEVINAARDGKNLMVAYFEYEVQQAKADAENVRKENNILKQNAAAAAKAPVKGSNGGGATDTKAKDPFLEGFDSDY